MSKINKKINRVGQLFLTLGFITTIFSALELYRYAIDISANYIIPSIGLIVGANWFIGGLVWIYNSKK